MRPALIIGIWPLCGIFFFWTEAKIVYGAASIEHCSTGVGEFRTVSVD